MEPDNLKALEYLNLFGIKIEVSDQTKLKNLDKVLGCKGRSDIMVPLCAQRCDEKGNTVD